MSGKKTPKGQMQTRTRWVAPVVLAVAAVVLAVAVVVATREPAAGPPVGAAPSPSQAAQTVELARRMIESGQLAQARKLMEAYVRANAADVAVRPLLAEVQLAMDDPAAAEQTADQLLRVSATADAVWLKGQLVARRGGDAMPFYRQAASAPSAGPAIWARMGHELLATRAYAEAEDFFTRARKGGLSDASVLAGLGELAMRQRRDWPAAAGLLAEASKADPSNPRIRAMLAEAQRQAGDLDAAAATLEAALRLAELSVADRPPLQMALGGVRERQERWLDAAEQYRDVSAYDAARCYYIAGEFAAAMEQIDKAVALRPEATPEAVLLLKKKIEDARFGGQ